ncbi:MAG: hypothetical protein ACPIOQ_25015, partial [Promethearchaeia archaeon]
MLLVLLVLAPGAWAAKQTHHHPVARGRQPGDLFTFRYRVGWTLQKMTSIDPQRGRPNSLRCMAHIAVLDQTNEYSSCECTLAECKLNGVHFDHGNVTAAVKEEIRNVARAVNDTDSVHRAPRPFEPVYFHWERSGEITQIMHAKNESDHVVQKYRAVLSALQVRHDTGTSTRRKERDVHGVSWHVYDVKTDGRQRVITRESQPYRAKNGRAHGRFLRKDRKRTRHKNSLPVNSRQRSTSILPLEDDVPTRVDFTHNVSTLPDAGGELRAGQGDEIHLAVN